MLKARLEAASKVKDELISAENAVDEALQRLVALLNTMCEERTAANLPLQVAELEFEHVATAVSLAGKMRAKVLAAHRAFVDTRAAVLPTVAWGDVGDCPSASAPLVEVTAASTLKAVA